MDLIIAEQVRLMEAMGNFIHERLLRPLDPIGPLDHLDPVDNLDHLDPLDPFGPLVRRGRRAIRRRLVYQEFPRFALNTFHSHFRMTRMAFEVSLNRLSKFLRLITSFLFQELLAITAARIVVVEYMPQVTVERKMLMTIWWLANKETYRQVGDRFRCSRGNKVDIYYVYSFFKMTFILFAANAQFMVMKTCKALSRMADNFIGWPARYELARLEQEFNFPGTIGKKVNYYLTNFANIVFFRCN